MKLLSSNFSPFSTRVRIQINKKDLPIDICPPTPALRTPEFIAKYPLGKIPVLEFADGSHIAESWAIMEYLEAQYPQTPLRPDSALEIAQMNMLCRYADLHLGPALFPLFVALLTGSTAEHENEINDIKAVLAKGERMIAECSNINERSLTIGDIALACSLFFAIETPKLFGCDNILADFKLLTAWWQWVNQDPAVANGVKEMAQALAQYLAANK
ncbi:glutathione S-transferase family protein [Colwellia sp. MEBiC06753]